MNARTLAAVLLLVVVAAHGAWRSHRAEAARRWQAVRDAAVSVEQVVAVDILHALQDPASPSEDRWWTGAPLPPPTTTPSLHSALGRLAERAARAPGEGNRIIEVSGERFLVIPLHNEPPIVLDWAKLASEAESRSGARLSLGERPAGGVAVLQEVLSGELVWLTTGGAPASGLGLGGLLPLLAGGWVFVELSRTLLERARARAAEGAKTALLQRLSHELRTPAAAVRSLAEALRSGAARGQEQDFLSLIEQEAVRLAVGIDRVLRTARSEEPMVEDPASLRVDLRTLVEAIAARWRARIGSVHVDGEGSCEVIADPAQIGEAFEALLDNAVVHGAKPIRISLRAEGTWVALAVEDSGPGIPDADRARVIRRGEGQHTGIGLWVADEVARAHRGALDIHKSRLVLRLPRIGG